MPLCPSTVKVNFLTPSHSIFSNFLFFFCSARFDRQNIFRSCNLKYTKLRDQKMLWFSIRTKHRRKKNEEIMLMIKHAFQLTVQYQRRQHLQPHHQHHHRRRLHCTPFQPAIRIKKLPTLYEVQNKRNMKHTHELSRLYLVHFLGRCHTVFCRVFFLV